MNCPSCGYLMNAFDSQCARCHGKGINGPVLPPPLVAPTLAPPPIAPPPVAPSVSQPPAPIDAGNPVASLVLGIVGLVAWIFPTFGLPISLCGLVVGLRSRAGALGGLAVAGVVLSAIGLTASVGNYALGTNKSRMAQQVANLPDEAPGAAQAALLQSTPTVGSSYEITPAKGWTVKSDIGATNAPELIVMAPEKEGFTANLNVVVVPAIPGETLDKVKSQIAQLYLKMFSNYSLISQTDTQVGGETALQNIGSYELGTPPRKILLNQVIVLKDSRAYTFSCTSLEAATDDRKPALNAMLASIRWTKKAG